MVTNWFAIDNNFPSFTGKESPREQIQALHSYLFQLREGLRYSLQNLTLQNFNSAALDEMTADQKSNLEKQVQLIYSRINQESRRTDALELWALDQEAATEDLQLRSADAEERLNELELRVMSQDTEIQTAEDRLDDIEEQLGELTAKVEELTFLIEGGTE